MFPHPTWFLLSAVAFATASIALLVTGYVALRLIRRLLPILEETHNQVKEIGSLSVVAIDHANETMDLVEKRVSQAMSQANEAGAEVSGQALSAGSVVAGIYLVSRFIKTIRSTRPHKSLFRRR